MTTATAEKTQTTERQELYRLIESLSNSAIFQVKGYIERLREEELEALEDAEDIAYIKSLTPEDRTNAVPFEEVVRDFEAKHGPLYQD
jgi:hypothetical protein